MKVLRASPLSAGKTGPRPRTVSAAGKDNRRLGQGCGRWCREEARRNEEQEGGKETTQLRQPGARVYQNHESLEA